MLKIGNLKETELDVIKVCGTIYLGLKCHNKRSVDRLKCHKPHARQGSTCQRGMIYDAQGYPR